MRITVLGKSPSWQDAGGACSGYLLEQDGHLLLLDCGNGVFGRLRAAVDYATVDTVVLSHLHADHFLDLVPFSYALTYGPRTAGRVRPLLHAPPGARDVFRRVVGAWGNEDLVERAFDLHEYDPDAALAAGPLRLRFARVPHYVPTHAVEVTAPGGARFTFGADCGPSEALVDFARDTDLLLVEASLPSTHPDDDGGHMTAREAGEQGRRAGARRVVLTHITDELDADQARADAAEAYGAPVEVAAAGAVYEL